MTIEQDIRAWALTRPAWQQDVLVGLAKGERYGDPARIEALADRLLEPGSFTPSAAAEALALGSTALKRIRIRQIRDAKGVNALAADQVLTFAPDGLTIVYGDNGSGKSGYARIIKAMVSARHSSRVLPDVYTNRAPDPSADLEYTADAEEYSEKFPADPPIPDLQQVRFYDEHCGDEYLTRESRVTYRPSALVLLDGLVNVCDQVRAELQRRIAECERQRLVLQLPQNTPANAFFARLSDKTTDQDIDDAATHGTADDESLGKALQEVARLEASDATKEQARLRSDAAHLTRLSLRLAELEEAVSAARLTVLEELKVDALTKREAATLAASDSFEGEPGSAARIGDT